jgi:hypothetical protein
MRVHVSHFIRISAALLVGLAVACGGGDSPSTGNFSIWTVETVTYQGAQTGTFSSFYSAYFYGAVIGTPPDPHQGTIDHFNGTSGYNGVYHVQDGIVPAYWGFLWRSGPCEGGAKTTGDQQIQLNTIWEFECKYTRTIIGDGYETFDDFGNPVNAACCGTDTMTAGMILHPGDIIQSQDTRFTLQFQDNGDLVLYDYTGAQLWDAGTYGSGATEVDMQSDGNLVVYAGSTPVWATSTAGYPGAYLLVQNDGNVVVYDSSGSRLWATNTCCR